MSKSINVGASLRKALLYAGKTQAQLARELKLSAAQINIHCKATNAQQPIIKRYADHFGYTVEDFLALGDE